MVVCPLYSIAAFVQAKWARALGWMWSQLLRQLLDTLRDTISTESPTYECVLVLTLDYVALSSVAAST